MSNTLLIDFVGIRIISEAAIFNYIPKGHPHRPASNAILFIRKGRVVLKEFVYTYNLESNHFLFIDSNHVYEVIEVSDDLEITLLGYQGDFLERISFKMNKIQVYRSLKSQVSRNFELQANQVDILYSSLDQIERILSSKEVFVYLNEIIEHSFIMAMYQVASVVEKDSANRYITISRSQKLVNDFIFLVSENYLQNKHVKFYAEKLGITMRYLSAVVKAETSKTPQDFINEFIVTETKARLSNTSKTIKEIAFELSFYDQYTFSNFVFKHLGVRPSEYRSQFLK
jgi:AraC family transcriptional regulator, transcriptional activator of pobA